MKQTRLIKNIGFYFLGTFSTKILQLLFIPIYTKYIVTSDFGYYNLVLSILALSIPLLYQSIWEGVLRFSIEQEGNEQKILATTNIYCIGITIIYTFIFLIFYLVFKIQYGIAILIMGISQMGASYWQFTARALKKNKIYAKSTVVNSLITIALNIILIVFLRWGLLALFIANIMGNIAMIITLESNLKLINGIKKSEFDIVLLKSILKYSIPLSINAVSWWLVDSSNNLIISNRIGIEANGIYSMASRFGSILNLITSVVNMAWLEEAFRIHSDNEKDKYFNKVLDVLIRLVLTGVIMLIPTTYIFYKLFVFGGYNVGVVLVPIIYLSAAFSTFASHLGSAFLANKESKLIFKTSIVGGLVSTIGGFIMAKPFGLIGVVGTSLLGYIIMFIIRIPFLNKRIKLEINYVFIIGMTFLCLLTMIICKVNDDSYLYQFIVFIVVGVIVSIINRRLLFAIFNQFKKR